MEAISIILTIFSIGSLIYKYATKISDSRPEQKEYMITANLKVSPELIASSGIEAGETVKLEPSQEVHCTNITATGTSWTPVELGTLIDYELFQKVKQNRAQAKIYAINGDVVTIELKYN